MYTCIERNLKRILDGQEEQTTTSYLKEKNNYRITDPVAVIAGDVWKTMTEAHCHIEYAMGDEVVSRTVSFDTVPSIDYVEEYVKGDIPFFCTAYENTSDDGPIMKAEYRDKELEISFHGGSVLYLINYIIHKIPEENLCFLCVEDFQCHTEDGENILRFYHETFTAAEEAERYFAEMPVHKNYQSEKELLLLDKRTMESPWARKNREINQILQEHPELDTEENFRVHPLEHLRMLCAKLR